MEKMKEIERKIDLISDIMFRGVPYSVNYEIGEEIGVLDTEDQLDVFEKYLKKHFGTENPDEIDYENLPIHPDSVDAHAKNGTLGDI